LQDAIRTLRLSGFDRVWLACKACPVPELAIAATASGAGLLITSASEAKRLNTVLTNGNPWGFALLNEERWRDLLWLLRRFSPGWVSIGDENSLLKFTRQRSEQPATPDPALLLRIRPPKSISTACGYYGFAPEDLLAVARHPLYSGLHFHIGSNRSGKDPYLRLLKYARESWERVEKGKVYPRVVNLGGGFSVEFSHWKVLYTQARLLFPSSEIWVEPGRFLVQRSLFWVAQARVRENEIWTGDAFPISTEARRNSPRLKGFLRAPSGDWVPITAEAIGARRLRIISSSQSGPFALQGCKTAVFYDCAAYHWWPPAPLLTA
jgi:diaminopimelate decarboxylase